MENCHKRKVALVLPVSSSSSPGIHGGTIRRLPCSGQVHYSGLPTLFQSPGRGRRNPARPAEFDDLAAGLKFRDDTRELNSKSRRDHRHSCCHGKGTGVNCGHAHLHREHDPELRRGASCARPHENSMIKRDDTRELNSKSLPHYLLSAMADPRPSQLAGA